MALFIDDDVVRGSDSLPPLCCHSAGLSPPPPLSLRRSLLVSRPSRRREREIAREPGDERDDEAVAARLGDDIVAFANPTPLLLSLPLRDEVEASPATPPMAGASKNCCLCLKKKCEKHKGALSAIVSDVSSSSFICLGEASDTNKRNLRGWRAHVQCESDVVGVLDASTSGGATAHAHVRARVTSSACRTTTHAEKRSGKVAVAELESHENVGEKKNRHRPDRRCQRRVGYAGDKFELRVA